jgi:hypothetical protein
VGLFQPVIGGLRVLGVTARSAVADVVSAAARAGEAVSGAAAGREPGDAVLRVSVIILSDEQGIALCPPDAVLPALRTADEVLTREAGIRVRVTGVTTVAAPAPAEALDPHANRGLLLDEVLGRLEHYRTYLPTPETIAGPVTVVVVRSIAGNTTGCSLGMTADWVVCQASLFDAADPNSYDETVLVHELGHALNLPHHRDRANLMFPSSSPPEHVRGTALQRWQAVVLQTNRHTVHPR